MDKSQEKEDRKNSRIGWLVLFLVLILVLDSAEGSMVLYGMSSVMNSTTPSKATLASTQNRIAVVNPIFSSTAYSSAFYSFYSKYISAPTGEYITTDLNLLNRTVVTTWMWSLGLYNWFQGSTARSLNLILGETVTLINDIDVDSGALFSNGERLYDVVIVGFIEYVTEREYLYYKQFVASGGTLIIMNACNFLAEVTYSNGYLSLTKGHGWEFNGTHARKSVYARWYEENINWIGGNYWRYWTGRHYDQICVNETNVLSNFIRSELSENIPTPYGGHEENLVQNMTGTDIIGYWNFIDDSEAPDYPVAAYMHRYGEGMVIHSGIMGSEAICSDSFLPVFLAASIRFGLTGEISQWTYPEPLVSGCDFVESTIVIRQGSGGLASTPISAQVHFEINFNATKDVLRNCYRCNLQSVTGVMNSKEDTDNQAQSYHTFEAAAVNETCWQFDMNTYYFTNGEYTLTFNATWEGVKHAFTVSETIEIMDLTILNNWLTLVLPLALPLSAMMCAAVVIILYKRFYEKGVASA
jgi:hypothetical protein